MREPAYLRCQAIKNETKRSNSPDRVNVGRYVVQPWSALFALLLLETVGVLLFRSYRPGSRVPDGQCVIPVEPGCRDGRLADAIAGAAGRDEPNGMDGKRGLSQSIIGARRAKPASCASKTTRRLDHIPSGNSGVPNRMVQLGVSEFLRCTVPLL